MEVIFLDSIDNGTWSLKDQVRMEQNYMRWFVDMKKLWGKSILYSMKMKSTLLLNINTCIT